MITHNNNSKTYLLVAGIPIDASDFEILKDEKGSWLDMIVGREGTVGIDLPPGNWQIIGKASELSEAEWKEISDNPDEVLSSNKLDKSTTLVLIKN